MMQKDLDAAQAAQAAAPIAPQSVNVNVNVGGQAAVKYHILFTQTSINHLFHCQL